MTEPVAYNSISPDEPRDVEDFLLHCGVKMIGGYRLGEFECPECGLLWNMGTNAPLKLDMDDTGAWKFYSREGRDVEY